MSDDERACELEPPGIRVRNFPYPGIPGSRIYPGSRREFPEISSEVNTQRLLRPILKKTV